MMWWSAILVLPLVSDGLFYPLNSLSQARSGVVINELYYDHPGADDGWEYIELMSIAEKAVELSGWRLEFMDGNSGRCRTLWESSGNLEIAPGERLLLAQHNRAPAAGFEIRGSIENGPDAIRLVSPSAVEDILGYGNLSLPDLFEFRPAACVPPGKSLSRRPDGHDTDRNDIDFISADPTPGRKNFFDRDISIHLAPIMQLPCAGSPFSLLVRTCNTGINELAGTATITLRTQSQPDGDSSSLELHLNIASGECDSFVVDLVAPYADLFRVDARIELCNDEDPSNNEHSAYLYVSPSSVVINEIMYRPQERGSEWVELLCRSKSGCDLCGWTISDATGEEKIISVEPLFFPGSSYLILARDSAAFVRQYPACTAMVMSPIGGWPSLNDSDKGEFADIVSLRDSSGAAAEIIAYSDLVGSQQGISIERISPDVCSSFPGGLWHRSVAAEGATPGGENSVLGMIGDGAGGLSILPNPFSPGKGEVAVVATSLRDDEIGLRIRIFTIEGIEIRRLFGEIGGSSRVACRWDGRAGDGTLVPSGIYICLAEYLGGGGVCRKEKGCIVVSRR